jgi:predicted nuclease with TOPRIM domain
MNDELKPCPFCGLQAKVDELTAERDELEHANKRLARKLSGVYDLNDVQNKRIKELEAEAARLTIECDMLCKVKDRLKRENGELKDRNNELETALERMDELLVQKQRVIDITRESFKKLEYEITVLKKKGAM